MVERNNGIAKIVTELGLELDPAGVEGLEDLPGYEGLRDSAVAGISLAIRACFARAATRLEGMLEELGQGAPDGKTEVVEKRVGNIEYLGLSLVGSSADELSRPIVDVAGAAKPSGKMVEVWLSRSDLNPAAEVFVDGIGGFSFNRSGWQYLGPDRQPQDPADEFAGALAAGEVFRGLNDMFLYGQDIGDFGLLEANIKALRATKAKIGEIIDESGELFFEVASGIVDTARRKIYGQDVGAEIKVVAWEQGAPWELADWINSGLRAMGVEGPIVTGEDSVYFGRDDKDRPFFGFAGADQNIKMIAFDKSGEVWVSGHDGGIDLLDTASVKGAEDILGGVWALLKIPPEQEEGS